MIQKVSLEYVANLAINLTLLVDEHKRNALTMVAIIFSLTQAGFSNTVRFTTVHRCIKSSLFHSKSYNPITI